MPKPKKLKRLEATQSLVRIERKFRKRADTIDGVISGVGREWVVVETLADGVHFDGWTALRVADIGAIKLASKSSQRFLARAKAKLPAAPPMPHLLADAIAADTSDSLFALLSSHQMVGVYIEREDPDLLFIGCFDGADKKDIALQQIDPQGVWSHDSSLFRRREITRVSIGGRYQNALEEFGEARPAID